ncbi:MAG: TraR/DksA C4-type zinc finger protein [Bacteroidota bacterium]
MATKKKAVKPAAKKPAKPAKKAAPAKKVAPKKVATKSAAKKPVKPTSKSAKPTAKKVVAKKAAPAKKITKPAPKVAVKKAPVVKAVKPTSKPMTKKVETKKPAPAPKAVAPAKPSAPVKAKDIKVPAPKPVVIPKISTKTVRKYQPDFTKSVLDKAPMDPGAPSQRYSDGELSEFKELIQRKLEAAKKELAYLHGLITRKDEMGGDDTDNRYMTMEDGSLSMEREQLSQMASRQITFIDHLEKAIMRIENKTYGICRVTGKLIDKARLRAVPHATLSIEAKMGAVK